MNKFFPRLAAHLREIRDLEIITFLTLLLSSLVVLSPLSDVFTAGKTYRLISDLITEEVFGSIILFLTLCSLFSMIDRDRRFRSYTLIAISLFWGFQFTLFLTSNTSGYLTWLVSIFALSAIIPAARLASNTPDSPDTL